VDEVVSVPEEINAPRLIRKNEIIDRMSGTTESDRCPDDCVSQEFLEELRAKLDEVEAIRVHVDAYIAHSLVPKKLEMIRDEDLNLEWGDLTHAIRNACQVFHWLYMAVFDSAKALVPIVRPLPTHQLHVAVVKRDQLADVELAWKRNCEEVGCWCTYD
jgi:hypothetical protein